MDDLTERYARLVAAWDGGRADDATLAGIAVEAAAVASDASDGSHRILATALAAAARAARGDDVDVAAIIDASVPDADEAAVERLEGLLPGPAPLADRVADHERSTAVPPDALGMVATRLVDLLHRRAAQDLGLPPDVELPSVEPGRATHVEILDGRIVLDERRPWTVGGLLRAVSAAAVPGGHLAERLRPSWPEWRPSPHTTVDHGMRTVGPEVLLGDHELAHEIGRIGRAVDLRWPGDLIVAVARARDELAPAIAAVACSPRPDAGALRRLGMAEDAVARHLALWEDPLERADAAARAAGPPLVRAWLVRVGQTTGLARLLRERLTPSELRAEGADG